VQALGGDAAAPSVASDTLSRDMLQPHDLEALLVSV
jgi:hypothetical protein